MNRVFSMLKKSLFVGLCLAVLVSCVTLNFRRTQAAAAFSMSASAVSDGAFTLTLTIPGESWNTFNFTFTFDHKVVQVGTPTMTGASPMLVPNVDGGNSSGTFKVNGMSATAITAESKLVIPFTVKDAAAKSVVISFAVADFASGANQISHTAASPVTVTLKNTGKMDADEVIQVYVKCDSAHAPLHPVLCGFKRVHVKAGEEITVEIPLTKNALTVVTDQGDRIPCEKGVLYVGGQQPDELSQQLSGKECLKIQL